MFILKLIHLVMYRWHAKLHCIASRLTPVCSSHTYVYPEFIYMV